MTRFTHLATLLLVSLTLFAGVTACATRPRQAAPPTPIDDPASGFPAKITLAGQDPVTILQQPKRIVSLSPTATETLYAIGAGEPVVAVDQNSNFPARTPRTPLSALNAEAAAIAGHNPDLVLAPDSATQLVESLRAIDVPVLLTPSAGTLEDAYHQIETLGRATGHTRQAQGLTQHMRHEIDTIVVRTPKPPRPLSYYHEVSADHYTATSRSFVGSIYSRFGLTNIADSAGGKFPQLSAEHIIQANPDLIFLANTKCCGVTPRSVGERPGWNTLTAVRDGHVVGLDDDVAGRWGPRIIELVRAISAAITAARDG